MLGWVAAFAMAPMPEPVVTAYGLGGRSLAGHVVRQELPMVRGGSVLRLRLTNAGNRHRVVLSSVRAGGVPVRVRGARRIVLAPGAEVRTDPVRLPASAGTGLPVALRVARGPVAGALAPLARTTLEGHRIQAIFAVAAVEVRGGAPVAAVLGDSIAGGRGASVAWPALTGTVAPAVDGGTLLRDLPCFSGVAGRRRLGRDVLRLPGVRSVVVALGTNDLVAHRGLGPCGGVRAAREDELVAGLREVAARLRARGLRPVATTIPPRGLQRGREATRRRVNAWLRTTRAFDAVADVDRVLRDPADTRRMDPAAGSRDGLHPGDAGQRRIAAAVRAALGRADRRFSAAAPPPGP